MKYSLTISTDDPAEIARHLDVPHVTAFGPVSDDAPAPAPVVVHGEPIGPAIQGTVSTSAPANADRDARGFPWDERIHAKTKAVNKDGTWRYRRNLAADEIEKIEAELKSPTPVAVPTADGDALAIPYAMQRNVDGTMTYPPGSTLPDGTVVPVAAADTAPAGAPLTYEKVVNEMTDALTHGRIGPEYLPTLYQKAGVTGAHELVDNVPALTIIYHELTTNHAAPPA